MIFRNNTFMRKTMSHLFIQLRVMACVGLSIFLFSTAYAATEDLGNGFFHHGVATPISNHRGTVATVDGDNRDVVLVWLFDCRGGYALLMIDAETGKSEQAPMPFAPGGDCPYASILSSGNKFYTHFNSNFCEFDPVKRAFTFSAKTAPQMAMGMTEDTKGVIWSVTYPNSGVVSFNPATREFKDYGCVHKENWAQYQRYVATDDAGWLYFGIGNTASQIIAFNPATAEARPMIPEAERINGSGFVCPATDGRVYGHAGEADKDGWYEFHGGEGKKIGKAKSYEARSIITSSQGLFHTKFPDGKELKTCNLGKRTLSVVNPKTGETKEVKFDYTSEGANIMGVAAAPDGTACGGTAFPMCFFSYNPKTDAWINRECFGQWNTVARQGDRFFAGAYSGGYLLEWDPARPWVATEKGKAESNPLFLAECHQPINRPHKLLAHPDGKTLVLAGTPGYGYTGGGLLFWDRETKQPAIIEHTAVLPQHSTISLAALPDGLLLGGSTISPGTGGETKATQAELYLMNMATKEVTWHEPVIPGAHSYNDLCTAPNGLIYGIADGIHFFVFDAAQRKVIYQENTSSTLGHATNQQGPRVFVLSPEGKLYMLFNKGIAAVDLATHQLHLLASSPIPVGAGGDYLDGRIYFANGSHLYSYMLPK